MEAGTAGARCAIHPDRLAEGTCKRCGNFACAECSAAGFDAGTLCVTCASTVAESRYHVVPVWRFVLMSLLTNGLYQLYWFWKNWSQVKRADGSNIWPLPRAVFGGVTYFMLLTDLNTQLSLRNMHRELSVGLGVGVLAGSVLRGFPGLYSLLGLSTILFLLPAVTAANDLASEASRQAAAAWRWRHTLLVLCGIPFTALSVIGLLAPGTGAK
jgi:hypothetical protein